eukprot:scpid102391/ scgid22754/ 
MLSCLLVRWDTSKDQAKLTTVQGMNMSLQRQEICYTFGEGQTSRSLQDVFLKNAFMLSRQEGYRQRRSGRFNSDARREHSKHHTSAGFCAMRRRYLDSVSTLSSRDWILCAFISTMASSSPMACPVTPASV